MQISAANLLATQSQAAVRPRAAAAAFEPLAFKEAPAANLIQDTPKKTEAVSGPQASASTAGVAPQASSGYVRPGSTLDIKI